MATPFELSGPYKRTQQGHVDYYYGGGGVAYADLASAKAFVPSTKRSGQTVGIIEGSGIDEQIVEYIWHPSDITDAGLVKKTSKPVSGTPNKIVKIAADGESLQESGMQEIPAVRNLGLDYKTLSLFPSLEPNNEIGGLVLENNVLPANDLGVKFSKRSNSTFEEAAYLSDITPPVDVTGMTAYEANVEFTVDDVGDTIYFTKDNSTRFFVVLQAFTAPATDPPNPDTDVTAGNLSETNQEKATKVLDWKSGNQYLYSKDTVVKDPLNPVLYRAKVNVTGAVALSDTNSWENITVDGSLKLDKTLTESKTWLGNAVNKAEETDVVNIQGTNDISREIFTLAYLTQTYGDYKPGEKVINNQQTAEKTITSWDIKDTNKPSLINIDLDDTAYYTVATGVLDLSEVNTAKTIVVSSVDAAKTLNKITGLIEGRLYKLKFATGLTGTITHTAKASLSTGDFYLKAETDLVLTGDNIISDFLEFEVINQYLIETNSVIY